MNMTSDRQWWPFAVDADLKQQSAEIRIKLKFLTEATRSGCKAYIQNGELEWGAIGDNGRECLTVRRGTQRAEIILWKDEEMTLKRMFISTVEGEASDIATSVGLRWLIHGEYDDESKQ